MLEREAWTSRSGFKTETVRTRELRNKFTGKRQGVNAGRGI